MGFIKGSYKKVILRNLTRSIVVKGHGSCKAERRKLENGG